MQPGSKATRLKLRRPFPVQRTILDHPASRKVLHLGRRAGKTELLKLILLLGHGPGAKFKGLLKGGVVYWIAPNFKQAEKVWRRWMLPFFEAHPGLFTVQRSERSVECRVGGGYFAVVSAEAADNARGDGADLVIVDEARDMDLEYVWEHVAAPLLVDRNGSLVIAGTPRVGSYFNKMCHDVTVGTKGPAWAAFRGTARDNPYINPEGFQTLVDLYPAGSTAAAQEVEGALITAYGDLFQRAWFGKRYAAVGPLGVVLPGFAEPIPIQEILIIADLAASIKQTADYTVVKTVARLHPVAGLKFFAILNVQRERIEGPDQIQRLKDAVAAAQVYRAPVRLLIESVAYQLTAVQSAKREIKGAQVEGVRPDKDKRARATPWAAMCSRGEVWLPASEEWVEIYIQEHVAFPNGAHDDQVDTGGYLAAATSLAVATVGALPLAI